KHAWVYRQISLLLERAPGREAYPGDIFYIHSQLMERAGYLNKEHGGGSMTFFPIIDILQGDVTGYISSNLVSMTDGQIYFDSALFYKGFKPAIDLGLSVSRIGSKGQWSGMKDVSKSIRLEYLQYLELLQITQLHAGTLSKEAEESYRRNQIIGTLLVQDKNRPVPVEQQIIYFFAWGKGLLDNLTEEDIGVFKEKIFTFAQSCIPKTLVRMRGTEEFTEDDKIMVDKCVRHYISGGLPGPMEEELEEAKKESEGTEEEAPRT
ncbi:MAG: F0F1 ATP synthase subunit alpha, partial [Candidatus Omnitrophica bacterium]|nr:F0F1 ATP synthase subunit alpha [Candidatus Omnitrophota bacterium]